MGCLCPGPSEQPTDEFIASNKQKGWDKNTKPELYIEARYVSGKTLGKGGSCRVVEAKDREDGNKYALKIMGSRERMNEELWNKEVKILALLKHPNIIRFKEAHKDNNNYYILSELCEGGELFDRIVDKNNPITEKRASELVRTMLEAIKHCHDKNIVHRDLKPENFVFKTKAQDSEMVLIDFGCAKVVDDEKEYKDLVGTPYYLAPESAAGHKYIRTGRVLKSSDIWSIGVIAYVLMTGRPPFNGHSNTEIFSSIIKKPLKFPAQVKLSEHFIDFCQHMLKKSPKRRMKMEDALKHAWIVGTDVQDTKISDDVLRVLRQFNQQSKLKKAITKTLASHMGKEPQQKIKEHFKRLDKNGDGALDAEELKVLLMDMGYAAAPALKEAKQIIKASDADGSGEIEFDEFAAIWQRKLLSVNQSYIHAVFTVLDEDGNGQITAAELGKVLDCDDMDEIKSIIKEVDDDGDGMLNFEEFQKAMKETGKDSVGGTTGMGKVNSDDIAKAGSGDEPLPNWDDEKQGH